MTTSLAKQLQGIQKSVTNPNFQKRKKVASLLFEAADAADQDIDQVFAIGINGLEELVGLDISLSKFTKSIFSEQSRAVDRTTQTKEQNDALDRKITSFLNRTSRYFLLRPLLKCLEWLVRRFDVHIHLADALILTYMPYHASANFARLLSILHLPPAWSFLTQIKQNKDSPSMSPFIKAFSNSTALLRVYLDHVLHRIEAGQGYHAMVELYADITVRTITYMRDSALNEDSIASIFVPIAGQGLQIARAAEFHIANYMIISVLSAARNLSTDVFSALSQALVATMTAETRKSGMVCLAQLFQTRNGDVDMSAEMLESLLSMQGVEQDIIEIFKRYNATKFLDAFCSSLLRSHKVEHVAILESMVNSRSVPVEGIMQTLVNEVLSSQDAAGYRASCATLLSAMRELDESGHLERCIEGLGTRKDDLELILQLDLGSKHMPRISDQVSTGVRNNSHPAKKKAVQFNIDPLSNYMIVDDSEELVNLLTDRDLTPEGFQKLGTSLKAKYSVEIWLSLLIRLGLSGDTSQTQLGALSQLSEFFRSQDEFDAQILLPLLLTLLSSKSVEVRKNAFDMLDILQTGSKAPRKRPLFYGIEIQWLDSEHLRHFLQHLSVMKAEILLDHKLVYRCLGQYLPARKNKTLGLTPRNALFELLGSLIQQCPRMKIVLKCLLAFQYAENYKGNKTAAVLPLVRLWSKNHQYGHRCRLERIDPHVIQRLLIRNISPREDGALEVLSRCIEDREDYFGPLAIDQLVDTQGSIRSAQKSRFYKLMLDVASNEPSSTSIRAKDRLQDLELSVDMMESLMLAIDLVLSPQALTKRRKVKNPDLNDLDGQLKEFNQLLELLELDAHRYAELLPLCFTKLNDVVQLDHAKHPNLALTKQLLLTCMSKMIDPKSFNSATCRIDIVINCIRTSQSSEVHNRALLLVAAMAESVPEQVLHGVMPIFTFMGANVLRHDDGFSTHVVESTIERVIPPLLRSMGNKSEDQVKGAKELLRSFVDAFPQIPRHRQVNLYISLVRALGVSTFLGPMLALLIQKGCRALNSRSKDPQKSYHSFILSFLKHFPMDDQIEVLKYLANIASQASTLDEGATQSSTSVDIEHDTQPEVVQNAIFAVYADHLDSRKFKHELQMSTNEEVWNLEARYIDMLTSLLRCVKSSKQVTSSRTPLMYALDTAIMLLPRQQFMQIVHQLLARDQDELIRVKVLEIISKRASTIQSLGSDDSPVSLVALVVDSLKSENSSAILSIGWQSLSQLGRKYGKVEPSDFVPVVELTETKQGIFNSDQVVQASAIECLTTSAIVLGPRILPYLQRFMPLVLRSLSQDSSVENADLVSLASMSLLGALLKTIPAFMSPYTIEIMSECADYTNASDEMIHEKQALLSTIAKHMATRNVLSAIGKTWQASKSLRKRGLLNLVTVLEETIDVSERKVVTGSAKEIMSIILLTLDIRRTAKGWDVRGIEQIEKRIIAALIRVVMKLNDSTFRPLFMRLRDWALSDLNNHEHDAILARQQTFFNFFAQFLATFKSIVLSYVSFVYEDIIELLEMAPDISKVPKRLWTSVFGCLMASFVADNEDYWRSPDKFQRIAPQLIRHLSFSSRYPVITTLIPAIVEFTAVVASEENFKFMNTQILQLFRAEDPEVRLAAVTAENQLSARLGEEWLSMLPQTIPFIAEAMEDADPRVEKQTQALTLTIESCLGESIDKFLK